MDIFLNDEATQNAYLIATNSEGGHRMLGRHHSLRIGVQGIVGYVAARGEPRVARNVGEDIVYFNNPDLPATKSEAALPLRSTDKIIGVLDVQSPKEDAFRPDDLRILAVLADQVSLAIENSRLLEATQRSLSETETLYRQYVRDAWRRFQPDEGVTGLRFSSRGSTPIRASDPTIEVGTGDGQDDAALHRVPITLRGETIGDLIVHGGAEAELVAKPCQCDLAQVLDPVSQAAADALEARRCRTEVLQRR